MLRIYKKIVFLGFLAGLLLPSVVFANSAKVFFVDSQYDRHQRESISAVLLETSRRANFYIDQGWWDNLTAESREEGLDYLKILAYEFEENIFPVLSKSYNWSWSGIERGQKINIIIHPMRGNAGGYFRPVDQYDRLQNPVSNDIQAVYLNSEYLHDYYMRSLLAHEMTHLITFHKKEKRHQVQEEVWLNEARAEYSPALVGYDRVYEGSNLQRRAKTFLEYPNNSLVGWENRIADYGALNLFVQYLVDHYGLEVLSDSLESEKVGIPSLNEALAKNGYQEKFAEIYTNWAIAVLVNDCSLGQYYCFHNNNLKDLRIVPKTNFLPLNGESSLSSTDRLQNWSTQWLRFIGGDGDLLVRFFGQSETLFNLPYVAIDRKGNAEVGFIDLNEYQNGEINIPHFGSNYYSITIIPSIQSKESGFNGSESYYPFKWEASTTPRNPEEALIQELQKKIDELLSKIVYLRSQISLALARQQGIQLGRFDQDMSYGLSGDQVRALQLFLAIQEPEVYPEGLVTGHFYGLTRQAIIRFQEKYADYILAPAGLSQGTGYVGPKTREKLNELLFFTIE
jgi:peptidoglycan hydrolase-like protein with peptidoglycan-binding domain